MGVVTKYGSGAVDPSLNPPPVIPVGMRGGKLRNLVSKVAVATGDAATSLLYFGALPSKARISPAARLYFDALTGVTSFHLGDPAHPNALVNALNIATAGSDSAVKAVAIANYDQPLWKVLGFPSDPGGQIDIVGKLNQDAAADGSIVVHIPYALD